MPPISDEAIVLGRLDYSETSQVLVLLTRGHGKVRAIAKGIRRSTKARHAAGVDLLDLGDVVVYARATGQQELATLSEWRQRRVFPGVRERLDRLYAAQYAAEVTAGLTEDWDPHRRTYAALAELLEALCVASEPGVLLVGFGLGLLDEVGLLPQFSRCTSCGRPPGSGRAVHFSSFEGGLVCHDCEAAFVEKLRVPVGSLAVLCGGGPATGSAGRGALQVLDYHISHLMGRAPKLSKSLDQVWG